MLQKGYKIQINQEWYDDIKDYFLQHPNPKSKTLITLKKLYDKIEYIKTVTIFTFKIDPVKRNIYIVSFEETNIDTEINKFIMEVISGSKNVIIRTTLDLKHFVTGELVPVANFNSPLCPRCENGFASAWPGYAKCSRCGYPGINKIKDDDVY